MTRVREITSPLLWLTVSVLLLLLGARSCAGLTAASDDYTDFGPIDIIGTFFLACLFFANVGMAIFQAKKRVAHLSGSLMIVLTSILLVSMLRSQNSRNRQWLVQTGLLKYQAAVEKISQNKSRLTAHMSPLDDIVDSSALPAGTKVRGATNEDGSLTIQFIGRCNDAHEGYLYYSGTALKPKVGRSNPCFFERGEGFAYWHLTNNWYEY